MITTVVTPAEEAARAAFPDDGAARFPRPVPRQPRVAARSAGEPSSPRVRELRDAVRAGTYEVDCAAVAAALAERLGRYGRG